KPTRWSNSSDSKDNCRSPASIHGTASPAATRTTSPTSPTARPGRRCTCCARTACRARWTRSPTRTRSSTATSPPCGNSATRAGGACSPAPPDIRGSRGSALLRLLPHRRLHDPVAAGALGPVERVVGGLQQRVAVTPVGGERRHADRHRHPRQFAPHVLHPQRL